MVIIVQLKIQLAINAKKDHAVINNSIRILNANNGNHLVNQMDQNVLNLQNHALN